MLVRLNDHIIVDVLFEGIPFSKPLKQAYAHSFRLCINASDSKKTFGAVAPLAIAHVMVHSSYSYINTLCLYVASSCDSDTTY